MCYFLHRLVDFRMPELRALADMHGVKQLQVEPIPQGGGKTQEQWRCVKR